MRALLVVAVAIVTHTTQPGVERKPIPTGIMAIEGVIVADGDVPLSGVTVQIVSSTDRTASASTTTDAHGRYAFENIAEGRYTLMAKRLGYAGWVPRLPDGRFGDRPLLADVSFAVLPDAKQLRRVFDLKMFRGAILAGRITDDAGHAVKGAIVAGTVGSLTMMSSSVTTDERGEFEMTLGPGDITIQVRGPTRDDGRRYLVAFYPGVQDRRDAAVLRLSAGDVARGLDITLLTEATYTIRGRVVASASTPADRVALSLGATGALVRSGKVDSNGSFVFPGVQPTRYVISARSTTNGVLEAAWHVVTVDQPVHDVDLFLGPTGSIRGRIVTDTGEVPSFDGVHVAAALTDDANEVDPILPERGTVAADGSFSIEGVYGPRRLSVPGLAGWSGVRILVDDVEVTGPHVTVVPGVAIENVRIVISR